MIKITDIKPNNANPRSIKDAKFRKLCNSIKDFDKMMALRPIVVDIDGTILGGNMRYKALLELGYKEIPNEWVKCAEGLTDEEKQRFIIEDNVGFGEWDWDALANEWDTDQLDAWGLEVWNAENAFGEGNVEQEGAHQEDEEEIERKKREFEEKMKAGELDEDDPEYQEFLAKFEAKKTTDDCYTPELVYNAVADWVANEYKLRRANFVRPFYPGGDYQREKYKPTDIVVDNPPFSIMSEILQFYAKNNIKYFLFGPHLTLFSSSSSSSTAIPVGVGITYANGAVVNTSFLTNLEMKYRFRSEPRLYAAIKKANEENLKATKRELPKYVYDHHVITTPFLSALSRLGIDFKAEREQTEAISQLDGQKESGKAVFGKGYLISDALFAEREKAEREKVEREKVEREKVEREKVERWELSDRERAIIEKLNKATKIN